MAPLRFLLDEPCLEKFARDGDSSCLLTLTRNRQARVREESSRRARSRAGALRRSGAPPRRARRARLGLAREALDRQVELAAEALARPPRGPCGSSPSNCVAAASAHVLRLAGDDALHLLELPALDVLRAAQPMRCADSVCSRSICSPSSRSRRRSRSATSWSARRRSAAWLSRSAATAAATSSIDAVELLADLRHAARGARPACVSSRSASSAIFASTAAISCCWRAPIRSSSVRQALLERRRARSPSRRTAARPSAGPR